MNVQGLVICKFAENDNTLIEEYKSAFESVLETYITPTPINIEKLSYEQEGNELLIKFEFDKMPLKYNFESSQVSSIKNSAEFGRALFELYAKFTAEEVSPDQIKVESKLTTLTIMSGMKRKTI